MIIKLLEATVELVTVMQSGKVLKFEASNDSPIIGVSRVLTRNSKGLERTRSNSEQFRTTPEQFETVSLDD